MRGSRGLAHLDFRPASIMNLGVLLDSSMMAGHGRNGLPSYGFLTLTASIRVLILPPATKLMRVIALHLAIPPRSTPLVRVQKF